MATLPNAQSLGQPNVPHPTRGIATYDGSAGAKAMIQGGEQLQQSGKEMMKVAVKAQDEEKDRIDRLESAQFMLGLKQAESNTQKYILDNPNDYGNFSRVSAQNYDAAYKSGIEKISDKSRIPLLETAAKSGYIDHQNTINSAIKTGTVNHTVSYITEQRDAAAARIASGISTFESEDKLLTEYANNSLLDSDNKASIISSNRKLLTSSKYDGMNALDAMKAAQKQLSPPRYSSTNPVGVIMKNELSADGVLRDVGDSKGRVIGGINSNSYKAQYAEANRILKDRGQDAAKEYVRNFYQTEIVDKYHIDRLSPDVQDVVADGLVNHGAKFQTKLLQSARDGASREQLIQMRQDEYNNLAASPSAADNGWDVSKKGWDNRLAGLKQGPYRTPDMLREDGSVKGPGFLGSLYSPDGKTVMTEKSIGINIDGKNIDVPSLVPTLTKDEVEFIRNGGDPRAKPEIVQKAADYAKERVAQGKGVFATEEDAPKATTVENVDVLQSVIKRGEAQVSVELRGKMADYAQAQALGAPVPVADILQQSANARELGNYTLAEQFDAMASVQQSVEKLPKMSAPEQVGRLETLNSMVRSGDLSAIDELAATQKFLQYKSQAVKENAWGYYDSVGLVNSANVDIFKDPLAIDKRREDAALIAKQDGITLPLITSPEVKQLKLMYERGDDVAPALSQIASQLKSDEELRAVAFEVSKEGSSILGSAMSSPPEVAKGILAGSRGKPVVSAEIMKPEISAKLNGIVALPAQVDHVNDAVSAYYNYLSANDDSGVVNRANLDRAVLEVIGDVQKVSFGGVVSNVPMPRGMKSYEFESLIRSTTPEELLNMGGIMHGEIKPDKLLEKNALVMAGNGQYNLLNRDTREFLYDNSGALFVLDINKIAKKPSVSIKLPQFDPTGFGGF
jgi:hypothetical protein